MIDLVKRLRTMAATGWNPIGDEAADTITALRDENEKLRTALEDILSWAEEVAGDTMDMEAREIEIASVERALAVLGKNHE